MKLYFRFVIDKNQNQQHVYPDLRADSPPGPKASHTSFEHLEIHLGLNHLDMYFVHFRDGSVPFGFQTV